MSQVFTVTGTQGRFTVTATSAHGSAIVAGPFFLHATAEAVAERMHRTAVQVDDMAPVISSPLDWAAPINPAEYEDDSEAELADDSEAEESGPVQIAVPLNRPIELAAALAYVESWPQWFGRPISAPRYIESGSEFPAVEIVTDAGTAEIWNESGRVYGEI